MHANRIRDGLQVERAQVRRAVDEELFLHPHDFCRHLEHGAGALFETAGEPVTALQAFGQKSAVGFRARAAINFVW